MINLTPDKQGGFDVLCLGAHCDDIEIGCGGTLLTLKRAGKLKSVKWVIFTSNERRKQEALACAGFFLEGVSEKEIIIHDFRDGFLPFRATEVKERFEEMKSGNVPALIFTHYRDDRHQDHRLISELTWNTFRDHLILEYEIPKWDGDLGVPNAFVGIEEDILKEKIDYLFRAYTSQSSKHWFDPGTFSALPRIRGMESASRYAEAFYARKTGIHF